MKLQLLAEHRLSNPGKCNTCKFSSYSLEYGTEDWDCTHKYFEKLPELNEEEECINWGTDQMCPLWEPLEFSLCEKHNEWYPLRIHCSECEAEAELEESKYGF